MLKCIDFLSSSLLWAKLSGKWTGQRCSTLEHSTAPGSDDDDDDDDEGNDGDESE